MPRTAQRHLLRAGRPAERDRPEHVDELPGAASDHAADTVRGGLTTLGLPGADPDALSRLDEAACDLETEAPVTAGDEGGSDVRVSSSDGPEGA
ncbi:hypothetical protein Abr02nite_60620 [Paractinoplanes brasiliensis]|nr:hypothetical protein Abr02nite_60620 [Actinoplanes brasiliensis]